jgi:hypothetical protein
LEILECLRICERTQLPTTAGHNNRCAEMLATVRRGPFARSTQEERIEFLLTRLRKTDCKVAFGDHALEHTLSFQRRVQSIKQEFLRRGASTPLGITQDYWDRTEAQQRGALHAHILVWLRKRKSHPHWQALPPVPRTVKGNGPKQRPLGSQPQLQSPLKIQHDSCYQNAEMGRVSAEMPRPSVTPRDWGGYDVEMLRVASLARTILIRLKYLHICSPVYCLKNSSSCRFFFPWPYPASANEYRQQRVCHMSERITS